MKHVSLRSVWIYSPLDSIGANKQPWVAEWSQNAREPLQPCEMDTNTTQTCFVGEMYSFDLFCRTIFMEPACRNICILLHFLLRQCRVWSEHKLTKVFPLHVFLSTIETTFKKMLTLSLGLRTCLPLGSAFSLVASFLLGATVLASGVSSSFWLFLFFCGVLFAVGVNGEIGNLALPCWGLAIFLLLVPHVSSGWGCWGMDSVTNFSETFWSWRKASESACSSTFLLAKEVCGSSLTYSLLTWKHQQIPTSHTHKLAACWMCVSTLKKQHLYVTLMPILVAYKSSCSNRPFHKCNLFPKKNQATSFWTSLFMLDRSSGWIRRQNETTTSVPLALVPSGLIFCTLAIVTATSRKSCLSMTGARMNMSLQTLVSQANYYKTHLA